MPSQNLLIDAHSHVYLPGYAAFLRTRTAVPRILTRQNSCSGILEDRLLFSENDPSGGRLVGPESWDRNEKIAFMDKHGIDVSIVSSASPWLEFLTPKDAVELALSLNTELEEYCSASPLVSSPNSPPSLKRIYGFGLLPLVPSVDISAVCEVISQVASLPHLKGIVIGTRGLGKGLDDDALEPVWEAIEKVGLVVFMHPHYGVAGGKEWGERNNGIVLPLALGFPMETTIATARLILAGVFDRYPDLCLFLAHSGGALPQLSSRLSSCISHDPVVAGRLKHDARWYLQKLWYDAVSYGPEELEFVSAAIGRADRHAQGGERRLVGSNAAARSLEEKRRGAARMLWGTDHPFFAPPNQEDSWRGVVENLEDIEDVQSWTEEDKAGVRGGNAVHLFGLADS